MLFSRWFDRVYDVARNIVRSPDTAADVAQDTFIAAWERLDRLEQVDSFGGWLLRIARNRALDRLEREGRSRPQEGETVSDLVDAGASSPVAAGRTGDPSELVTAADRDGLIAAAAVALGERDASLLDLHLRHGLTPAEIADELGVTANNAHQLLFRLRNRLGTAIGAYVLWHRGRPQCPTLAGLVGTDFDAASMTVIERHRGNCDDCTRRRAVLVAPEQLFSAAPVLIAPVVLRDRVQSGLARAGVPAPAPSAPGPATASPPAAPTPPAGPTPTEGTTPTDTAPPIAAVTAADPTAPQPRAIGDGVAVPPGDAVDPAASRRRIAVLAAVLLLLVIGGATVALATHRTADTTGQLALDGTPPTTDPTAVSGGSPTTPRSGSAGTTALGALEAPAPTTASSVGIAPSTTVLDGALIVGTQPPAAAPPARTSPPIVAPSTNPPTAPPAVTTPPTNVPPAPETTAPPAAPATTPPPPATTAPPPPPPAPLAPSIVRFWLGSSPPAVICPNPSDSPRRFQWTTTDATAGTLTFGGLPRTVAATGQYDGCAATGSTAQLTVTGPGGTATASLTVG